MKIKDTGAWEGLDAVKEHGTDWPLAYAIANFCQESNFTVTDLGCGTGDYMRTCINAGVSIKGYDGNPDTETLTNGLGQVLDLANPITLATTDCVISLEVGEHIPATFEHIFIQNVCKTATKYIILSWAIPGQGGCGHVNCQSNEYIISQIEKYNFSYDEEITQILKRCSTFAWFKNTIMCFIKRK